MIGIPEGGALDGLGEECAVLMVDCIVGCKLIEKQKKNILSYIFHYGFFLYRRLDCSSTGVIGHDIIFDVTFRTLIIMRVEFVRN